jgi:DNA-binding PadR family transcriptional regulator
MTLNVVRVLRCFLADPARARYGYELMRAAGISNGTLYPILDRLQKAGWLRDGWEDIDPSAAGRPARRHYRLTDSGLAKASMALAEIRAETAIHDEPSRVPARSPGLLWQPHPAREA